MSALIHVRFTFFLNFSQKYTSLVCISYKDDFNLTDLVFFSVYLNAYFV